MLEYLIDNTTNLWWTSSHGIYFYTPHDIPTDPLQAKRDQLRWGDTYVGPPP